MKDYSLNTDDQKDFILSYKIDQEKIIIKLASGELYTIPYSKENETKILSKMEQQAKEARIKEFGIFKIIWSVFVTCMLPISLRKYEIMGGFYSLILALNIEEILHYQLQAMMNIIKKREIKKLEYFLEHREKLNMYIEKSENIKLGISNKSIEEIKLKKSKHESPFDINNINNYSLKDLKKIKENIDRFILYIRKVLSKFQTQKYVRV